MRLTFSAIVDNCSYMLKSQFLTLFAEIPQTFFSTIVLFFCTSGSKSYIPVLNLHVSMKEGRAIEKTRLIAQADGEAIGTQTPDGLRNLRKLSPPN